MLLRLDTKCSSCLDGIPNAFLRRYAESLSRFLSKIFRASLSSCSLPPDWLTGKVIPVYKNDDRLCVNNYRPISLTTSCCKLIKHIIANHILAILNSNGALNPAQHGFRKGFSTTTQLIIAIHNFSAALDKSGQIDVLFLDFAKAFDKVPHNKLLLKLKLIGVPPPLIAWIAAYLQHRTQFVEIGGSCSPPLPVTSGVPQGSGLGPLLFLIYGNDLVSGIIQLLRLLCLPMIA